VNLSAYFARIGYTGPATPTLDTLRAIHALHPAAIPFENIDVLLGRGISLDPDAVWAKLITARRGGYCYEQNGLLKRALTAMGYQVEGLIARVRWQAPPGAPDRPRSHMALRVILDGQHWLADVGFGGCVLTAPLRLETGVVQSTPHGNFRLTGENGEYLLEAELEGAWSPLYVLSPHAQNDVDYELSNWWTSTHPSSRFLQFLSAARTTPKARYALLNNRLTVRHVDGRVERHDLRPGELAEALDVVFKLPVEPAWKPLIDKAAATAVSA
jgi:N-hydroxyarylamine O-acetyltransferase